MMSATAYSGEERTPLSRMPEQVLITDVPPSLEASPFFSALRNVEVREAGDDMMDE